MIEPVDIIVDEWNIKISDNFPSTRNHKNPNRYNLDANNRSCNYLDCNNVINVRRTSGLCNQHTNHLHDLFLELDTNGVSITPPRHKDIVDALILWSSTRNFSLDGFFSELSFNILGNIPDVTSLSGDIAHETYTNMSSLTDIYNPLRLIVQRYFPEDNSSSYQMLETRNGNMSAILLANTFVGLLICEEANRGDRWFCRNIIKDESKTEQLGAAMPLSYYAAKSFPWGVELNKKVAHKLTL